MRRAFGRAAILSLILVAFGAGPAVPDARPTPPGRRAVEPAAPELPAAVVAAMQEARYADADKALSALAGESKTFEEMRAYLAVIRGAALRLSGKLDAARTLLSGSLKAEPKGRWAAKIRSELAAVELASSKFAAAESLAREEAEGLLSGDRKDRLAEVYRGFADRLLTPDLPTVPPDPEGAYALLGQARSLAKGETLRASLLLAMARASQKAGNPGRAVSDFQTYLNEYPKGADRAAVRYGLGESQLAAGQALPARLTWTDLARDLEKVDTREAADTRARALYWIAKTYGIPTPPDDPQMNLGVAALRRLLAAYPSHQLAVRAAYEIAASYLARGKSQEALAAFTAFLKGDDRKGDSDEARRERAALLMTARFQVGQVLQGQARFDEAIAAFKGYLATYPDGPQSADAQRAVLDAQDQIAHDLLRREKYADARAAFLAFAAQNPLDPRVPQALFMVGQAYYVEKKYDDAVTAWETLAGKFPGTEPAGHAQFAIASIFENEKSDSAAAIERYRKITVEPWHAQAAQRVALMEAKALTVVTERTFRSGETPRLKIATRNLEKLTFTAYKIDPETYFRKKHALSGVEALDIGLVAPDAEWTADVPGYGKYRPIETTYELKALEVPGVYVVKVSDEKALQATTMVVGSDLDVIVKTSREQVLILAQDMKTGKARPGARVLVSDDQGMILDARTRPDGVLVRDWDQPPKVEPKPAAGAVAAPAEEAPDAVRPRVPRGAISYLVLDGGDVAGSGLSIPEKVAQGLSARAYLYTDRPAYRPGQGVALRGVVREVVDGQYVSNAGATYWLEVYDSRGRKLVRRSLKLSEFGTFHESIPLDEGAPVGSYRVRLSQPGKSEFAGAFEVQAYHLEKIDLAFDLPRTVFYRGETVKGTVVARYQYGTPLANRAIALQLPDGRTLQGQTDGEGKYAFELETGGFSEEQALQLVARLPQDNVGVAATVMLAVRAFRIDLNTTRDVYLDGESFSLRATTLDAQGEPTGQTLSVAVLKRVARNGQVSEREASREELATDKKTGKGAVVLKVEDEEGGSYVVRASGTDRFGNPVIAERALTISGKKDQTKLRILSDRTTFKVGESAEVRLVNRGPAGTALLTWEADRILTYKVVPIKEGENALAWDVSSPQFPNFTLAASRMAPPAFHEARLDVRVERDLRVTIAPKAPSVGPGGEVEVGVTTTDQNGKPVAAEVSIALVDRSLLRLFGDRLPPIDRFFYDQSRTSAFASESSATFRYQPTTVPVPEAVVEDAAQQAAQLADAENRGAAKQEAGKQVQLSIDAPMPAAGEPAMAGIALPSGGAGAGQAGANASHSYRAPSDALQAEPAEKKLAENLADLDQLSGGLDRKASEGFGRELRSGRSRMLGTLARAKDAGDGLAAPRERFVETAYWNPSVVTGKDGKSVVTFRAPAALSEYRFTARGVSGRDTLVGQSTADLAVHKDFFVDLKVPPSVTQGDKPRFSAEVHHKGDVGSLVLRLTIYAGGREVVVPRQVEVKADGVEEVLFDPFDVPDGDEVRLTLAATLGDSKDEMTVAVPIRPWGVQAFASASGSSADDTTAFVALPPGREYEDPEMLVVISPTVRRMLVELALGEDAYQIELRSRFCVPLPPNTTADRAGDLLAAGAALTYLQWTKATGTPDALRLTDRVRGLVSELVSLQNEDGGWPWVAGTKDQPRPSDRLTSARAVWALTTAESLGLMTDAAVLDKAATWLTQEFAKLEGGDNETRATVLHALATRNKATFEQANSLNRARQGLSNVSLAYLALTFANLDRVSLGDEVLAVLAPRGKTEPTVPGGAARRYWSGAGQNPWHRSDAETTALAALAFARARPEAPELAAACDWLLAHRQGTGWQPPKAKGPALAALAKYYGSGESAEDRYRLVVTVNDQEVYRADVVGATEGQAVRVPRRFVNPADQNRVKFDIEGRGRFGYAVTLTGFTRDFGPDQNQANKPFGIYRRTYLADVPAIDGRPLAHGFSTALRPQTFENRVTQVSPGGKALVSVIAWRNQPAGQPSWERDFLVLKEHLPAGTTLVEGSVNSQASQYTVEDGVLTLYFTPDQYPNVVYEVYGYLPGDYRALPPSLSSAYEPGRRHLGEAGGLKVLAPGEKSTDPYRPTPDEQYARGKALFDAGRLAEAATHLKSLWGGYALRDDVARDAARMLLTIAIKDYNPRDVVVYFEVLKEKDPDRVISFDDIKVVGRAYGDLGEHERAFLVWRATTEASYLEDARVGEVLRQRGKVLDGIAYLLDLWRTYPSTASIQSDFFGLAQVISGLAGRATTDPAIRSELAAAGATKSDLLLQSIRLDQAFLAQSPKDPLADEASLALAGAFLDLEDFAAVVKLARRYAELYPKSTFQDSFQYSEALGRFHLGEYDRAIAVAEKIAAATYKDESGVDQPSPNKWQALYILGQIHDARREPAKALAYYRRVAERFSDAAGAVKSLTRKELKLAEVSVIRPPAPDVAGTGVGPRAMPAVKPDEPTAVKLDYCNIATADVKVYPVDLMRLYLTRRNLDAIAGIDLAGIKPFHSATIKLGNGQDFDDKTRALDFPVKKEGAYLVMVRGDDRYASGILLVSPLELLVLEEPESGRVRVTVRDARTKDFVPKVQVKVIGSGNGAFFSGETDLRGVFVAEGVRGQVTAVARKGVSQYAFHRGTTSLGPPPEVPNAPAEGKPQQQMFEQSDLRQNVRGQNSFNQERQLRRLEERYKSQEKGVKARSAY